MRLECVCICECVMKETPVTEVVQLDLSFAAQEVGRRQELV